MLFPGIEGFQGLKLGVEARIFSIGFPGVKTFLRTLDNGKITNSELCLVAGLTGGPEGAA